MTSRAWVLDLHDLDLICSTMGATRSNINPLKVIKLEQLFSTQAGRTRSHGHQVGGHIVYTPLPRHHDDFMHVIGPR